MNKWLSIALLVFCGSLYAQTCGGSCRCGDCPTDPNPPRPAPRTADAGHNDCDAWPGRCSGRPQFEEVGWISKHLYGWYSRQAAFAIGHAAEYESADPGKRVYVTVVEYSDGAPGNDGCPKMSFSYNWEDVFCVGEISKWVRTHFVAQQQPAPPPIIRQPVPQFPPNPGPGRRDIAQSGASPETAPKAACPRGYHLIWIWDNIDPLTPFGHWACTSDLVAQQPQPCMIAPGVPCQTIPLGQGRNG